MDHPAASTEFIAHGTRRVLTADNKAYRTLNPLAPFGDLRTRDKEIEGQVLRHKSLYDEGRLQYVDPLDISSMAWAAVELGYSAVHQAGASNARRREQAQAERQLESNVRLAGSFFNTVTWLAKKEPCRYDDEETYYAALGSAALQFARPLTSEFFQKALQNQYAQTIHSLVLAHAHLTHARSQRKDNSIIAPLVGLRAQLIGMTCLMRPGDSDAGTFLAMPPPTRHRNTFRASSIINNHWNLSAWRMPEQPDSFTLVTPPEVNGA